MWTHEIFHNFEQLHGIKPVHLYNEANKDLWPPAYRDRVALEGRTSELWYYHLRFQDDLNKVDPALWRIRNKGLGGLHPSAVEAAHQRFVAAGLESAKKADTLRKEAAAAIKDKQLADGESLLWQARALNPGNNRILADLSDVLGKLKNHKLQGEICVEYLRTCGGLPETLVVAKRLAGLLDEEKDGDQVRKIMMELEVPLENDPEAWNLLVQATRKKNGN